MARGTGATTKEAFPADIPRLAVCLVRGLRSYANALKKWNLINLRIAYVNEKEVLIYTIELFASRASAWADLRRGKRVCPFPVPP